MLDWQKPETWSVLIVDDEPDNLELVAIYLTYVGAKVKTAQHGLEGLEMLETFQANLLLIDLSMPKMDGWELKAALRSNPRFQGIATIALTAHAMPSDREQVQSAGFDGYLAKPINLPTFLNDLQNAVNAFYPIQESKHATA